MKNSLLLLILIMLVNCLASRAQQFSPTAATPCSTCAPAGYTKSGGPDISNPNGLGGNSTRSWQTPGLNGLPIPPSLYSQGLAANAGKNSFVSLATSDGISNDGVSLTLAGFVPGKTYTFIYNVLSGSVYDPSTQSYSNFGEQAKLEITTTAQNVIKTQTTTFDGNNQNKWITRSISFTPNATDLIFRFSGHTTGNTPGYVNIDVDNHALCPMAPTDVQLSRSNITTPFTGDKINLNEVTVLGATPPGSEIVWKLGANANDVALTSTQASNASISNQDPMNVKPYYAFYYHTAASCYSVATSNAELKFTHMPTQVPLKNAYVAVSCTEPNTDLTAQLDNPIAPVVWYTTNNHQGSQLFNPQAAPPGDYYGFYYNLSKGGFSLPSNLVSTAHIKVENPIMPGTPDLGPTMSINSLIFPPNGNKDFVVRIQNILPSNSGCSVFFKVTKLPGFTITYNTQAGQSNVDGGIFNNNDMWVFSEDNNFITVTSKYGISASGYSDIGFKMSRNANTPANTAQNITVVIPQPGGGGDANTANNVSITTVNTSN